jgi:hypothetical protein
MLITHQWLKRNHACARRGWFALAFPKGLDLANWGGVWRFRSKWTDGSRLDNTMWKEDIEWILSRCLHEDLRNRWLVTPCRHDLDVIAAFCREQDERNAKGR